MLSQFLDEKQLRYFWYFTKYLYIPGTYSEPYQTSQMKLFAKIVNGSYFHKTLHLVCLTGCWIRLSIYCQGKSSLHTVFATNQEARWKIFFQNRRCYNAEKLRFKLILVSGGIILFRFASINFDFYDVKSCNISMMYVEFGKWFSFYFPDPF